MTKSILRYFLIVLIITLLSSCLISAALISNSLLKTTEKDMLYTLKIIDYAIDYDQPLENQIEELNPLAYSNDTRISIIDTQGNVVADTTPQTSLENHLQREEVQEAMQNKVGYARRYSETTKQDTLYVAYFQQQHILRLSIPYNGLIDHFPALIPALSISVFVSFIIVYMLSRRLAFTISKPMIEISESLDQMSEDFYFDLKTYRYQEFNTIVNTIENLSHRLRKSMREVRLEQVKMDELLKQMNEGFVLLDESYKILSINAKAISILGNMEVHDPLMDYLYYPEIINALENNIPKQAIEMKIHHNIYACYISRIDLGTTLLFVDITATKKAEKMRSEFFSNVSHELKTPMTSIRGYSELLVQDIVADEQQRHVMLEKIQNEVNSMLTLINDILMLSRIENMDIEVEMTVLKMRNLIEDVLESYQIDIAKHHINVTIDCQDVNYIGNHQQIHTLLNNLIGNAIKYNVDDGGVMITATKHGDAIKIVVEDTGIGIPLSDQSRVFERFYRVDKGRSKLRGGTGLGLAIVKHIVSHYKGIIHLESELNRGTTIDITLPQQQMKDM